MVPQCHKANLFYSCISLARSVTVIQKEPIARYELSTLHALLKHSQIQFYLSHVVNEVDARLNGDAHSLLQHTSCSKTLQPGLLDALHSLRYRTNSWLTTLECIRDGTHARIL